MDYSPKPIDTSAIELSPEIEALTELLARNTHEVWARQRLADGWTHGATRSDDRKEHPCLIPYEDLPESEKEYDRATALEAIRTILALGYRIEKAAPGGEDTLERVREICLSLPEVTVSEDGRPNFRVRNKSFAWYMDNHHNDGMVALWCKAAPGDRDARVAAEPDRFFVPPYVGPSGWLGIRLDVGEVDWSEIRELIEEAYRAAAPRRLAAQLQRS